MTLADERLPVSADRDDDEALTDPVVHAAHKRWRSAALHPDGRWYEPLCTRRTLLFLIPLAAGAVFAVFQSAWLHLPRGSGIGRGTTDAVPWDFVDPGIAFATAIVAIAVWYADTRRRWLDSLERRLTAIYVDAETNHVVMFCDSAPLAHEGDVRTFAVSISGQMFRARDVEFRPNFILQHPRVVTYSTPDAARRRLARRVREYRITMKVAMNSLDGNKAVAERLKSLKCKKRPYLTWSPPDFSDPAAEDAPPARPGQLGDT